MVLEGSIRIVHGDGTEELARAGRAYYWPEGHTGRTHEGCVFLEVGPVAEIRAFGDHAKAKLA